MKPSASDFAMCGDKYLGTPYSQLDCQAFFEAMLKGVGINTNLAGSNAWYREMMKNGWTGTVEDCVKKCGCVPVGAALYIWKQSGEPAKYQDDGVGNLSHIGVKTGRTGKQMCENGGKDSSCNFGDGAIHSSSSRSSVVTSKFADKTVPNGGWNRVGLWNKLDWGEKINAVLCGASLADKTKDDGCVGVKLMGKATVITANGLGVNMRASKSTSSALVMQIKERSEVVVEEDDGTWCKINYNGKTGYCKRDFLSFEEDDYIAVKLPRKVAEGLYVALEDYFEAHGIG